MSPAAVNFFSELPTYTQFILLVNNEGKKNLKNEFAHKTFFMQFMDFVFCFEIFFLANQHENKIKIELLCSDSLITKYIENILESNFSNLIRKTETVQDLWQKLVQK